MRNPRLNRWRDLDTTRGILLVAQKVEELLFDYTLDSYKAPALNTHTRCIELSRALAHVSAGELRLSSVHPIVEELADSVRNDSAAKHLLGIHAGEASDPRWWERENTSVLKRQTNLVLSCLWKRRYEQQLIKELRELIADGKEKGRMLRLTTDLVVEWMRLGFSRDYIYFKTKGFFFGFGGRPIATPHDFDAYLSIFEPTELAFDVCFRGSRAWDSLKEALPDDLLKVAAAPPKVRAGLPKERAFLKKSHSGVFLTIQDVKSLDPRSARNLADRRLTRIAEVSTVHVHREALSWEPDAVVWQKDFPIVLAEHTRAIHKQDEPPLTELGRLVSQTVRALTVDRGDVTWTRIVSAFGLHASAMATRDAAVQLSTLWAALETLLPAEPEDSKIGTVVELLVPVLSRNYPRKLLRDLDASLRICAREAYESVLASRGNIDPILSLASILAIDSNEQFRDQIYAHLSGNPLLMHRVYSLKKTLDSSDAIGDAIRDHAQRVSWQIRRIYRSRNLLLHSGKTVPHIDVLVENLHSYFHELIATLEGLFSANDAVDIDSALFRIASEHRAHLRALEGKKSAPTTESNLVSFVFGPHSSS